MSNSPQQSLAFIRPAALQWRDNGTPQSIDYDDVYFSEQDGLEETRYVFLQQNNLSTRWKSLPSDQPGVFIIAETGFGTGLNFLAAWQLWQATAPKCWRLKFLSFEKHPLTRNDLQRAIQQWPQLANQGQALVENYPALIPGQHAIEFHNSNISLHVYFGEALEAMQQWLPAAMVDAWFLDGFAPAKNPGMWSEPLFTELHRLSKPGTTFATFTAVGAIRRRLQNLGFAVEKAPGFGRKRDMLRGVLEDDVPRASKQSSLPEHIPGWAQPPPLIANERKSVIVIGGGLAGTSTAHALAARGWQVSLFERHANLACGASGNTQGVLYTKLSGDLGQHAQFNSLSFQYALRQYAELFRHGHLRAGEDGELCGVLQLAFNEKEAARQQQIASAYCHDRHFCRPVSRDEASELAGVGVDYSALFYPTAGWLNPERLCSFWSRHANIDIRLNCEVTELVYTNGSWSVLDRRGDCLGKAAHVVVANADAAKNLAQLHYLPSQSIRGQISEWRFPSNKMAPQLRCVVCHEGYVTPALHGSQRLGATFTLRNNSPELSATDHQENWSKLQQYFAHFAELLPAPQDLPGQTAQLDQAAQLDKVTLGGRVAYRCTSPDYMPMLGPAPDAPRFLTEYANLRKNARQTIDTPGPYLPGLYLNIAHASRGLSSTPLCAELLAAQISGEPLPLSAANSVALNPARFLIRDLSRNRI